MSTGRTFAVLSNPETKAESKHVATPISTPESLGSVIGKLVTPPRKKETSVSLQTTDPYQYSSIGQGIRFVLRIDTKTGKTLLYPNDQRYPTGYSGPTGPSFR